jgi:N6-adenosine-specific RNA methylase IME4
MSKFSCIFSDPPWEFSDKLKQSDVKRGAESQYQTMSTEEIKKLPVPDITENDAILVLWAPSSLLQDGLDVMNAWKFKQKQTAIWIKCKIDTNKALKESNNDLNSVLNFGMGHCLRNTHEIALIGTKGKILSKVKNKSQRTVMFSQNYKHSKKPEELQDRFELIFPELKTEGKCMEMFARRQRDGWTCLGNEIDGKDIKQALIDLKNI